MGKYVLLLNWTDQGIKNVKDTIKRAESFKSYLEREVASSLIYFTLLDNTI